MAHNPSETPNEVIERLRQEAAALISVAWIPLSPVATLTFRTHDGGNLDLRLDGVHCLLSRQSLRQGNEAPSEERWEDWFLTYVEVLTDSPFLQAVLTDQFGLPTKQIVYDSQWRRTDSADFLRPVHVVVLAGRGHLDIVCESCSLAVD